MRNRKPVLLLSCALPLFAACGSSSSVSSNADAAGPPIVYPGPVVENVPGLDIPFVAGTTFPLADVGYERHEYFFSGDANRSEERRVGKGCVSTCRSGWAPYHSKK